MHTNPILNDLKWIGLKWVKLINGQVKFERVGRVKWIELDFDTPTRKRKLSD